MFETPEPFRRVAMKRIAAVILSLAVCSSAFVASLALAQQAPKPEDSIRARKAGLSFMAWNMGQIKANLGGNFNKEQVVAAANVVAATANSGLFSALFTPGTEKDVAAEKTRVKAEFFQQPDKVRELADALAKEANELALVAAAGDVSAIKAQFGKTGSACKNCHDKFRND